jgi:hypothetical protein
MHLANMFFCGEKKKQLWFLDEGIEAKRGRSE